MGECTHGVTTMRRTHYSMLLAAINADPEWRHFELTNVDQGIRLAAWLEDTLINSKKHTEHNSEGLLTRYTKDDSVVCVVLMHKQPNSQDIDKVIIHVHINVVKENEILQQEMFDLFL